MKGIFRAQSEKSVINKKICTFNKIKKVKWKSFKNFETRKINEDVF